MEKKPDRSEIITMTLLFALTLALIVLKWFHCLGCGYWVRFGLVHIDTATRAACAGRTSSPVIIMLP